jgi:hypothetical protein
MSTPLDVLLGAQTQSGMEPPPGFAYVKACGAECGKDERTVKMFTCSGCSAVAYCSTDCQKRDWARHKPECKARRIATAALAADGVTFVQRAPKRKELEAAARRAAGAAGAGSVPAGASSGGAGASAGQACCFCGADVGRYGNSPAPLQASPARCCDSCNLKVVIPARFAE